MTVHRPFPKIFFKFLIFSAFSAFFVVKFCFIHKISQNYTDLWCILDIRVITEQAKIAEAFRLIALVKALYILLSNKISDVRL